MLVSLLLVMLALLGGCSITSTTPECQNFSVPNAAMTPTLNQGQLVVLDVLSYASAKPARGNLIVLKNPSHLQRQEVLRVIGLPGETVRLSDTQTFINGKYLEEPFVLHRGTQQPMQVTLGPDQYFVMGDNRPQSVDSRSWGPLPLKDIVGQINTQ
jgi:signal peptidase I